jgi:hypothetical protein
VPGFFNPLLLSPDGSKLFLAGLTGTTLDTFRTNFSVFDSTTLEQSTWQIGDYAPCVITGLVLSPLTYRIYATGVTMPDLKQFMFSIDASFGSPE